MTVFGPAVFGLSLDHLTAGGVFVTVDFCLSILGTVLNVIIVATIKNSSSLLQEPHYSLLASLGVSNMIITSFLKLLSSVVCGHAVARNLTEVPFQFCSIYIFVQRLTWVTLPYTVFFMSWLEFIKTMKQKYNVRDVELESSPFSRKSIDEQGVLTQRYLILKECQYVQIIKSLKNSQQQKRASDAGPVDSLHSIKNKWKSKIKTNKKLDSEKLSSVSRKWKENALDKKKARVMKQKSKSFDDELEPPDKALMDNKQSYSCSEIPQLSSIKEEGETGLRNIGQSKTYRRKMFAKMKTQQVTLSFSPGSSISRLSSPGSQPCIITLSSPESSAPPTLIFPDTSRGKEELRKQVSFDNSLDQIDQRRQSEVSYRTGRATTSILSDESQTGRGRARSVTSNTSTLASTSTSTTSQVPDLKVITIIWSLGLVYTMIEPPSTELCCLTSDLSSRSYQVSVVVALIFPLLAGPVLCWLILRVIVVLELCSPCKVIRRRTPSQMSVVTASSPPGDCLLPVMSVVFVFCYSSNMLAAPLLYPSSIDLFTYILLKQVIGYLSYIILPIAILTIRPEFRKEAWKVYKENVGKKELTQEEEEEEISKELLYY